MLIQSCKLAITISPMQYYTKKYLQNIHIYLKMYNQKIKKKKCQGGYRKRILPFMWESKSMCFNFIVGR
jgi:hypothetical protein